MDEAVGSGEGKNGDKIWEQKNVGAPPAMGIKGDKDLPKGSEEWKDRPGLWGCFQQEGWMSFGTQLEVEMWRSLGHWKFGHGDLTDSRCSQAADNSI